jgi:hypothetical protein
VAHWPVLSGQIMSGTGTPTQTGGSAAIVVDGPDNEATMASLASRVIGPVLTCVDSPVSVPSTSRGSRYPAEDGLFEAP